MLYRFGDCVLDTDRLELCCGTDPVSVPARVFNVLVHLISHDRVVSKDELLDEFWKGKAYSDLVVTTCIYEVRQAIGDSGEEKRLIQTRVGEGWLFVGEIQATASAADDMEGQGLDVTSEKVLGPVGYDLTLLSDSRCPGTRRMCIREGTKRTVNKCRIHSCIWPNAFISGFRLGCVSRASGDGSLAPGRPASGPHPLFTTSSHIGISRTAVLSPACATRRVSDILAMEIPYLFLHRSV